MPPAMKVTLKYEEGADAALHTTLKLTLPRKWKEGPTLKLKETFVENFNSKHPDATLELAKVHLLNAAGHALADNEIVCQVLEHGDHVRIKPGAPPERISRPAQASGVADGAAAAVSAAPPAGPRPISKSSIPTPAPAAIDKDSHVSSAQALAAARQPQRAFDYSKWDRLDLSDDDGDDCHPNIDKASWVRLMAQKRADRRKKEDEKIAAYKAKIEKYTEKAQEIQRKIDEGDDEAQLLVDLRDAQDSAQQYQAKLERFMATRKLTADDVCDVSEDHTVVAERADIKPLMPTTAPATNAAPSTMKPDRPKDEYMEYDTYIKMHRPLVDQYAALRSDEASEHFLYENPQVLHEHAEGYLLLLTLDTCMKHLAEKDQMGDAWTSKHERQWADKELAIARQHLLIQFVLTLSKGKHVDPRDMIKPFFRKTSKQYADRVEGFEEDLEAFVKRIRNRAIEKREKGERSPLDGPIHNGEDDEEYELADLGPGGLDPNEVLPTLPEAMQNAFIEQDTDALRAALAALPEEEAHYHMQRCIDSGLWRPGPGDEHIDQEEDGEEEAAAADAADAVKSTEEASSK